MKRIVLHERYRAPHAGIDVSDGLSLDLSRLAAESGCSAGPATRRDSDRGGKRTS